MKFESVKSNSYIDTKCLNIHNMAKFAPQSFNFKWSKLLNGLSCADQRELILQLTLYDLYQWNIYILITRYASGDT
jgi:hypothetical protein